MSDSTHILEDDWLAGVRSWRTKNGLVYVGEPGRVLFIDEQQPAALSHLPALQGETGRRLRGLLGCETEGEFHELYDALHLVDGQPPVPCSDLTIVLGRAAKVYGINRFFQTVGVDLGDFTAKMTAFPHPSEASQWWKDSCNLALAKAFLSVTCSDRHV